MKITDVNGDTAMVNVICNTCFPAMKSKCEKLENNCQIIPVILAQDFSNCGENVGHCNDGQHDLDEK